MNRQDLLKIIQVDSDLHTPKYKQISKIIAREIKNGTLKMGQSLPSINALSEEQLLSRETVVKAYNELKEKGIVASKHGKGYYVCSAEMPKEYNVCLLFNKLSAHKKVIYDAFIETLNKQAKVDLFVYHNDFETFKNLIETHAGAYTHYIIISHFYGVNRSISEILNKIPQNKLVILDRQIKDAKTNYPAVYQNFHDDLFHALEEALPDLKKYDRLNLAFPASSYHPLEIKNGFTSFCEHFGFDYRVMDEFHFEPLNIREAYILLEEGDLIKLLRTAKDRNLTLGKDIGVISYNENPLKEFISGGISVVSTDFANMGKVAAKMVLTGKVEQQENPFLYIRRSSC